LSKKYPEIIFFGIDPVFFNNKNIMKGSTSLIPLDNESVDLVLCIEVLQHERELENSFAEILRILKDNGYLFIGDRNKISILGMFKKIYEYLGKWMYTSDGPFKERWYTKKEWEYNLTRNDFKIIEMSTFTPIPSKIPFMNRYYSISTQKNCHG
jgi:SAM-dependent methyltransferase